jgi:hypothetical protein
MSIAWIFSRLKEQPTIFSGTTPRTANYPCPPYNPITSTAWYSKVLTTYKIYSGDGSTSYEFDDGFDYTSNWTEAENLSYPEDDYIPLLPRRGSLGPINPDFPDVPISYTGSTILTSHEYWLPVGKDLLLYYFYRKRQTAFQFTTSQSFVRCDDPSTNDNNEARQGGSTVTEAPIEVVSVNEHCLLVGKSSIKQLSAPTAFRDYLNARVATYSMVGASGYVNLELYFYFNGQSAFDGNIPYTGFRWQVTPAAITPPPDYSLWNQKRKQGFSVTEPFPGADLSNASQSTSTGYFITTAGGYESLVGDTSIDYDEVNSRAPNASNLNEENGFLSGDSWETIFDNSTELMFEASLGSKKYRASSVKMSQKARPQDSLSYTTPEGFVITTDWTPRIVIGHDWANSKHCRSQLRLLGFTDSNLSL